MEIAIIHEFGGGTVPARSFIRATMDERSSEILALHADLARSVIAGTITADAALARLGETVVAMVKARISGGISPALAASTLRKKGGKNTPLIATGQLLNSLSWDEGE